MVQAVPSKITTSITPARLLLAVIIPRQYDYDNFANILIIIPQNTMQNLQASKELFDFISHIRTKKLTETVNAMAEILARIEPGDDPTDDNSQIYRDTLLDNNYQGDIINAMNDRPDNEDVQFVGLTILQNLTVDPKDFCRKGKESFALDTISLAIRNAQFDDKPDVLEAAFAALANYTARGLNDEYINQLDIGPTVAEKMDHHQHVPSLQQEGAKLLNGLIYWNSRRAHMCVNRAKTTIKTAAAILRFIPWNTELRDLAFRALDENTHKDILKIEKMSVLDNATQENVIETVLHTMKSKECKDNRDLQLKGFRTMRNMWRFNALNQDVQEIMERNDIHAILRKAYLNHTMEEAKTFIVAEFWKPLPTD